MVFNMTERRPGPIIHINGYPGVGKYTIAKKLTELFPRLKLVHNKLFTDLADALVPRDSDDHFKAWETFHELSFEPILWSDDTFDFGYVFTNFIPDEEDSPATVSTITLTVIMSLMSQIWKWRQRLLPSPAALDYDSRS